MTLFDMMAMHTATLPAQELAALRTELAPHFGARVVDEGDRRILLIRVPRAEPDPVNDVETAVDFLDPRDVEGITHCLLLGDQKVHQVYARPLQDLMAERLTFDKTQAAEWRQRMPGTLAHNLYRSPADPRRRWRLAVRLPCASVKDIQESYLEELAERIGDQLESPRFRELAAVYLIASNDDVRMEPDHFVQELLKTWKDEDRKRQIQEDRRRRDEAEARRREAERATLLRELDRRFHEREVVARAPLRHGLQEPTARRPTTTGRRPLLESESDVPTDDAGRIEAEFSAHGRQVEGLQSRVDALTRRAAGLSKDASVEDRVTHLLNDQGFDVLPHPETPYAVDLAAERPDGDPRRVVFRITDRLDLREAEGLLRTARELQVDHVFCVAERMDDEARRRLVATKVTWMRPRDLATLWL